MKLIHYDKAYKEHLAPLVFDYFREAHTDDFRGSLLHSYIAIDSIISEGKSIYLLLDNDIVIGYLVIFIHNQYNMTTDNIYIDYIYIKPKYRSSIAIAYIHTMIGAICKDYNLDVIGTAIAGSSSKHNAIKVKGEVVATTYRFRKDDVIKRTDKYRKRLY